MANITIGELTGIGSTAGPGSLNLNDKIPVFNSNKTVSATVQQIRDFVMSSAFDSASTSDLENSNFNFILTKYNSDDNSSKFKEIPYSDIISKISQDIGIPDDYLTIEDIYGAGQEIYHQQNIEPEEGDEESSETVVYKNTDLNNCFSLGRYYYTYDPSRIPQNIPFDSNNSIPSFNMTVEEIYPNHRRQTIRPIGTYAYAIRDFSVEKQNTGQYYYSEAFIYNSEDGVPSDYTSVILYYQDPQTGEYKKLTADSFTDGTQYYTREPYSEFVPISNSWGDWIMMPEVSILTPASTVNP